MLWLSIFGSRPLPWQHLIYYRQISSSFWPKLLNINTFFRWNVFILRTSPKWYFLTFWTGKKSRLFRRFFQYYVICHYSKYMRLALTDFNKNRVFYRNCMWLQLSQIKKIHRRKREKIGIYFLTRRHKTQKNMRGITRGYSFRSEIMWRHVSHARKQK